MKLTNVIVLKTPVSDRYCRIGDVAQVDDVNQKIRCGGVWFDFDDRWSVEINNSQERINQLMGEIIKYTYDWIKAMSGGRKFSGHDFFSEFPQPQKAQISKANLDTLYYALSMISKYDPGVDLSFYDFLEDKTLKKDPMRMSKMELTWFLKHALVTILKYDYNGGNQS